MATTRTYDLTGWDDNRIEQGDRVNDGWYHAKISDVIEDFETDALTFEYTILGGPFEGAKVREKHKEPDRAEKENTKMFLLRKLNIRAKRLGIMPPEDQRSGPVSIDWLQLLGKECYLKVSTRTFTGQDGQPVSMTEPMFDGVFSPDDDRVPELAKQHQPCGLDVLSTAETARNAAKAAAKPAGGGRKRTPAAATVAASPAQSDFGDI